MKNILFKYNLNKDEQNYLITYKSCIDDYKKTFKMVVNEDEKNWFINENKEHLIKVEIYKGNYDNNRTLSKLLKIEN